MRATETGVCGNPPPENFEILKLGNATVIIHLFIFYLKLVEEGGGLKFPCSPSAPPSLLPVLGGVFKPM